MDNQLAQERTMTATEAIGLRPGGNFPPLMPGENYNYPVTINRCENGYMVTIGCKTLVSESLDKVFDGLRLWYSKPQEAMKKYLRQS